MPDLLCDFSNRLPKLVSSILDREAGKTKNFREETITDLIVGSMTAFEPFGVRVDFPQNESKTGEDMVWEFLDIRDTDRIKWKYLALHIQAKRAKLSTGTKRRGHPYWYYDQLGHGVGVNGCQGSQHNILINNASGPGHLALYMFYHPSRLCYDLLSAIPNIAGINMMFATDIGHPSNGNWTRELKKVENLGKDFFKLSDFLCFGFAPLLYWKSKHELLAFLQGYPSQYGSPDLVAKCLSNAVRREGKIDTDKHRLIQPTNEIPQETLDAVQNPDKDFSRTELTCPTVTFFWDTDNMVRRVSRAG